MISGTIEKMNCCSWLLMGFAQLIDLRYLLQPTSLVNQRLSIIHLVVLLVQSVFIYPCINVYSRFCTFAHFFIRRLSKVYTPFFSNSLSKIPCLCDGSAREKETGASLTMNFSCCISWFTKPGSGIHQISLAPGSILLDRDQPTRDV